MYKCTECGLEFEKKPDYCDCGNDEFVITTVEKEEPAAKPEVKSETIITEPRTVILDKPIEELKSKPFIMPVSSFALSLFIICIVLSFLILFAWNPKQAEIVGELPKTNYNVSSNIPSIDKFWKNPVKSEPVNKEEAIVKPQPAVSRANVTPQVKTVTTVQSKKTTTVPVAKNVSTQKNATQSSVVQKQIVKQPAAAEIEAQKAAESAKKAVEAKQKAENDARIAAEKARQAVQAKQEYASYKINLRNTIGKKIDFTKVIGDGDCIVSFKLDSYGNLVNRNFAKQSTNLTLNNAVYKAVMATPSFNPPPSAYKNETLKLNINFSNGNFAITLE